jgi:putative transferase (TIGR04331 family)
MYDQKHIWSNLDHEALPSHWDEWEKLDQRYTYLENLYENHLNSLTSNLNDCHRENHSSRYWRIILGPWLGVFVGVIYDRYLSIKSAIDSNKVTHTWIPPMKPEQWVPAEAFTFLSQAAHTNNNFNLYLYSRMITELRQFPFEYKENESSHSLLDSKESKPLTLLASVKKRSKNLLEGISKRVPDRFNQIVFSASGLSVWNLLKLQFSLRQLPYFRSPCIVSHITPINKILRDSIKLPQGASEFESLLSDLIVEQLPTSFLEGYSTMRDKSLDAFPKRSKAIFTSNDFTFNDGFQFWAATQTEQGAKLILSQHGGGYGMLDPLVTGSHELKICDKYFTWGWTRKDQPKIVPIAAVKLQGTKYKIKPDSNGTILWVTNIGPLFFIRIDHIIGGCDWVKYFLRQARFANVVCPEVFKLLLVRFHHAEYGWNERKRLADRHPSLKLYDGTDSMLSQIRRSRLCIHDFFGTTWIETLSMNFPTVTFWNPRIKIIKSAQPYLDDLRRVKILHDTLESAAEFVNEIYEDPMSWWMSPELQQAKDRFCYQFARKSDHWREEWKEELLKITTLP